MHQMTGPAGQIVQDMRRVDDRARPPLRLALEPLEEVAAAQQVEVDGDLVEQEDGPRAYEAHGELDAAALAVRDGVHSPAQVDVEDADELVAAVRVVGAADRGEQGRHVDVGAHDRVEDPLEPEVGDALERGAEGVDAADGDRRRGCEPLAGEEPQERRLAGAVGPDEERAAAGGQGQVDVLEAEGAVLEGVAEAADGDGGAHGFVCAVREVIERGHGGLWT